MTEVVTSTAAYVQPLLLTPKGQQAFGAPAPDSPQSELAIGLAASQQQHALEATQVAPTHDQPSLKNDGDEAPANRSFANQLPAPQPKAPEPAAPTTGPAKARVELSVLDITAALNAQPAPAPAAAATAAPQPAPAPAPQPAPKPVTLNTLGGGPAGPAQANDTPDLPDTSGVLGPAAVVKEADLANLAQNIFGAAFAPTQVAQPTVDPAPTQTQKNFIFAHRKLYAEQTAQTQAATGKFAAEQAKTFSPEETGKFAAQPAVAAATAGAQFAASAEAAQKLADKVQFTTAPSVETTTGEARLYDKVAQTDTQSQRGHGRDNPSDQSLDSRQSLYQRAQAVAEALGDKGGNPAVKKLVATLETYALIVGANGRSTQKTVRVTV